MKFEQINKLKNEIENLLENDKNVFIENLNRIRSNKISIDFLRNIQIKTSNKKTSISNIANLSGNQREVKINVFEKENTQWIKKSLLDLNLGYKVESSKNNEIYISLMPITGEIREKLIKECKIILENSKKDIRNNRQKILNKIKDSKSFSIEEEKKIKKDIEDIISKWNDKMLNIYKQKTIELKNC